jgi:hypothetical protein
MAERVFLKNTSPKELLNWLDWQQRQAVSDVLDHVPGTWHFDWQGLYLGPDPLGSDKEEGPIKVSLKARSHVNEQGEVEHRGMARWGGGGIQFATRAPDKDPDVTLDVSPPLGVGIEVVARCANPEAREFFCWLLQEMRERWTAREGGKRYLESPQEPFDQARRSGRPREKIYDEAYEKLKEGSSFAEVYAWFVDEADKVWLAGLADPQDSLKKALRYREKRENRE